MIISHSGRRLKFTQRQYMQIKLDLIVHLVREFYGFYSRSLRHASA